MPRNRIGGKGHKKKKNKPTFDFKKMEYPNIQEDQAYGLILKKLGDGRFSIRYNGSDQEVIGVVAGKLRKRVWLNVDDVVICIKDTLGTKQNKNGNTIFTCSIIHRYTPEQVKMLEKSKLIAFHNEKQENDIEFDDGYDEDNDSDDIDHNGKEEIDIDDL